MTTEIRLNVENCAGIMSNMYTKQQRISANISQNEKQNTQPNHCFTTPMGNQENQTPDMRNKESINEMKIKRLEEENKLLKKEIETNLKEKKEMKKENAFKALLTKRKCDEDLEALIQKLKNTFVESKQVRRKLFKNERNKEAIVDQLQTCLNNRQQSISALIQNVQTNPYTEQRASNFQNPPQSISGPMRRSDSTSKNMQKPSVNLVKAQFNIHKHPMQPINPQPSPASKERIGGRVSVSDTYHFPKVQEIRRKFESFTKETRKHNSVSSQMYNISIQNSYLQV